MVILPASILVLIYTFPSTSLVAAQSSSSGAYTLPNDITTYVPSCAQICFESFIQSNFPKSSCSTAPTLDCLCSHNSTSGYTAGEGAVQCIISESNVGFCQGVNSSIDVVKNAYNMCAGRANALPNTHATITATLVVQTSDPSIVLVATTSTDSSAPSSITATSSIPTTVGIATATGSPSKLASPTSYIAVTADSSSQTAQYSTAATGLTTPQIAGIAVGGGILAILAIGGLILWACLRRRKVLADRDSDFGTFQIDHGNSMEQIFRGQTDKKFGHYGPGGTPNGVAARVPPRVPPRVLTDPNMFSRRSIPMEEIGIAISPEMMRHSSKLLPDKPKLHVVVPGQSTSQSQLSPYLDTRPEQLRDSATTQFEEDISSPEEFSRSISNYNYGVATSQFPGLGQQNEWQQGQPARSITAPLQEAPRPPEIRKSHSHQSFSQPLQQRTTASSVYSGRGSLAHSEAGGTSRSWQRPRSYKTYNPYAQDSRESSGSVTSIESAVQPEPRTPEHHAADLSPVVESPVGRSPVGRSPVSYPKIADRRSDEMFKTMELLTQPNSEQWRQTEIEQAHKRRNQAPQDYIAPSLNISSITNAPYPSPARTESQASNSSTSSSLLAQRRGNKHAPALNLARDAMNSGKQRRWRVVNQDEGENLDLRSHTTKLTPKRIGDDLFLNVQKY